jgi:hypothetical protein
LLFAFGTPKCAYTGKHWLVRGAAQKTATYRSLRFLRLSALCAIGGRDFNLKSTLLRIAGAGGTRIVHIRALRAARLSQAFLKQGEQP